MERIKLDYKSLRAAVARRDRAHVEVEARKLRDQHLANLVIHGASDVWSVIMLVGEREHKIIMDNRSSGHDLAIRLKSDRS